MKILIVDDHPTNRKLLRAQLEMEDFTVIEAGDGLDALSVFEHETIDTIISDIMMPRMDGYRFCLEVRKSERLRSIPFIVYTSTFSSPGDEKLALEIGADRYITKPAPANSILDAIREVQTRPGPRPVPKIENQPELALMKEYSEQLVAKLEERNVELTQLTIKLQATQAQLRQLLAHSPAVIYAFRVEGQDVNPYVVSENINRLLGFTVTESCSFDWWATYLHPEDRERAMAGISETIEHGGLITEYRIRHKDGHYVWVEDNRRLVRDASGQPREIAGVWTDISERKGAEEALQETERRFRELLENVALIAMTLDNHGIVTFCNDYLLQLTGWKREEVLGADWFSKFIPEGRPELKKLFFDTINAGKIPPHYENPIKTREGELREVVWNNTMLRDVAGNIIGTASIGDDVTERRRAEIELDKTHKELLESSHQAGMAEVATSVLHNVGNVLNSVSVASTCLADSLRKSKAANLSKVVVMLREHAADLGAFLTTNAQGKLIPGYLSQLAEHLSGEQAAALKELAELQKNVEHIKDIVSTQQSGAKVCGVAERVTAKNLVEDALRMNASSLSRHNIQTLKEFEEVPPVMTQKHKVVQILVNLIRNASQACDASGHSDNRLTLRVGPSPIGVSLSVSDNGVGISPENLTRIFGHGFTTKKEGHGFGLHGAALAAKELGGALTVRSDGAGRGATFILELPLEEPDRDAAPLTNQPQPTA